MPKYLRRYLAFIALSYYLRVDGIWSDNRRRMPATHMKLTAFQVHKLWLIRAVLVLVLTCLAEGIVVWFLPRPIFWATLIGSSLPFTMVVFVAIPLLREESRKSQ
jgi:hypothetical protein